jgi:hypothetical protein
VVANQQYSLVLKQIAPLEGQLNQLKGELDQSQDRLKQCQEELTALDEQVCWGGNTGLRDEGGTRVPRMLVCNSHHAWNMKDLQSCCAWHALRQG